MYLVEPVGDDIVAAIAALPPDLPADFAELRALFEVSPWTVGAPLVPSHPTGLRVAALGAAGTRDRRSSTPWNADPRFRSSR